MKHRAIVIVVFCVFTCMAEQFDLPPALALELGHLEETYRVLDTVAEQVWPGWKNYREFPFLFRCENGLEILVGHPNPPRGFEVLPEVAVEKKKVYVDRRNAIPLEIDAPLTGGGGPIPFGTNAAGKMVTVVCIWLQRAKGEKAAKYNSERQILIYLHELFHCFQEDHLRIEHGNFRYNPDVDYAVYSTLEGMALDRAYREKDEGKAAEYLRDFLVARDLKWQGRPDRNDEESDELREGTATYAEVRALEVLADGYAPGLTTSEDPYYGEFKDTATLLKKYEDMLCQSIESPLDTMQKKCYSYGCFEALLLDRSGPDWQKIFAEGAHFLCREIGRRNPVSGEDRLTIEKRLRELYPYREVRERCEREIGARDASFREIRARRGKTYVINFKNVGVYAARLPKKRSFELGLIQLFPEGIDAVAIDDIELSEIKVPLEVDQLYHVIAVDTEFREGGKPYTVEFEKREGDVYCNATVSTPLFSLKAPRFRIKERGNRVKITVLTRR